MASTPIVDTFYDDISGFRLSWATTTTLTVSDGAARDSTNVNWILLESSVTINSANNGANGLDTGTVANSTLYYIYAIGDSRKYSDAASLMSASTSPTLPAGYDMYRMVGAVYTDGSAEFLPFQQTGEGANRWMWYDSPVLEQPNGQSATWADIDLSTSVPYQATTVILQVSQTPSAAGRAAYFRRNGSASTNGSDRVSGSVISVKAWGEISLPCDSDAIVEYKVDNASDSADVYVKAYLHAL